MSSVELPTPELEDDVLHIPMGTPLELFKTALSIRGDELKEGVTDMVIQQEIIDLINKDQDGLWVEYFLKRIEGGAFEGLIED